MNSEPTLTRGIIFSDSFIREEVTRKNSFIGTFQVYNLPQFPFQVPPFFVTAFITNLSVQPGTNLDVTARIEHPTNGVVIGSSSVKLAFQATPDRNETFEVPMPFAGVIFATAGIYKATILVNNELIGERALFVRDVRSPAPQQ